MPDRERRRIEEIVNDLIRKQFLRNSGESTVRATPRGEGATGAATYEVAAELKFFVKYDRPETLTLERAGFDILDREGSKDFAAHLAGPLIQTKGQPLMLFPLLDRFRTFHDWVLQGGADHRKLRLYRRFMNEMHEGLWRPTRSEGAPAFATLYTARLHDRRDALSKFLGVVSNDLRVQINDQPAVALADVLGDVIDAIEALSAPYRCIIHGDEHPKNLMVDPPSDWKLIDYSSVKQDADWVYSIAKLLHWWRVYFPLERSKSDRDVSKALAGEWRLVRGRRGSGDLLIVSFSAAEHARHTPNLCRDLRGSVIETADEVGRLWGDLEWKERLRTAYFLVVFGGIPVADHISSRAAFARIAPAMIADAIAVWQDPDLLLRP